jgi:hypothetical protein
MPQSRMRVPCISSVSPSMTLACPVRSFDTATTLDKASSKHARAGRANSRVNLLVTVFLSGRDVDVVAERIMAEHLDIPLHGAKQA